MADYTKDELNKLLEEGLDRINKALSCENIGHSYEGVGFGGGMIFWKCRRCGKLKSEPDKPMSIYSGK